MFRLRRPRNPHAHIRSLQIRPVTAAVVTAEAKSRLVPAATIVLAEGICAGRPIRWLVSSSVSCLVVLSVRKSNRPRTPSQMHWGGRQQRETEQHQKEGAISVPVGGILLWPLIHCSWSIARLLSVVRCIRKSGYRARSPPGEAPLLTRSCVASISLTRSKSW